MNFFKPIFLFTVCVSLASCNRIKEEVVKTPAASPSGPTLFSLVHAAQSGLNFNNELSEAPNTNILMYEYFYNGGGVATADFNGDGLIDIYFTSNMNQNKLFLNKGNLKFQDITEASGAGGRTGPWKTGVSVADVNGDKRLDIFVCYSGMVRPGNRVNQLFINQGNNEHQIPVFSERSEAYGLTHPAYTNQAYFFDFDKDADLDLLLLNHNPVNLPILNEVSTASLLQKDDPEKGIRLLRQDKGKFVDITIRSGINGSALTYGLGAGIADLNDDSWPDLYISNDYSVPDYLYINNKDGTFTNTLQQSLGHTSQFSMGNDIADINNDGLPEIFTLDMLPEDNHRQKLLMAPDNYAKFDLNLRNGFYYQYMRNMLHFNNGDGTFSEIGQFAGVSNTDWSWAALLADYDNDGFKDLFVTNGYVRDYTNLDFIKYMDDYVKSKGRLIREEVVDIIKHMPASNVVNYIFANENGTRFKPMTKAWGINRPSNSNGAAYADLDNDGDLDLIVNNINQSAYLYRNNADSSANKSLSVMLEGEGLNTMGIGAKVSVWSGGKPQIIEQMPSRGYLSAVSPVLHFGLGTSTIDSIEVRWLSGKRELLKTVAVARALTLKEADASFQKAGRVRRETIFTQARSTIVHEPATQSINDFKRQPLLLTQLSYIGPKLVKGDANNDGLEDVYICGNAGDAGKLFLQQANKAFVFKPVPDFERHRESVDADALFLDVNGDGFDDLYVASGGYHNLTQGNERLQDRLYVNDGRGNFTSAENWLPPLQSSKSCVASADFNGDGRLDLFVGGRVVPGRYPESPGSFVLLNEGDRFTDQTSLIAPQLGKVGMVTDALSIDVNHDGKADLVVAGEWMRLTVFQNEQGKLIDRTTSYFTNDHSGWWNSLDTADFNNDGYVDLVAGNFGLNSQCRASQQQPAEMYFRDFDNNGSVDPLLCFYIQGKSYPYVTRDELLEQIGSMRTQYINYESYADVTITEVINKKDLEEAGHLSANDFETRVFLGSRTGKFFPVTLPAEAQYSPVYASQVLDFDNDGNNDVLLAGNNSKMKIKIGKYDANYGVLLRGDGNGGFEYISQQTSGLQVKGDVRSIICIDNNIWFGINDGPLSMYRLRPSRQQKRMLAVNH